MNYTDNYHLPQWEKADRILMDDFNQLSANVEDALTKNALDAASGNSSAAAAASAAQRAQSTANSALTAANAAYCPTFKPYTIGSYTGNGYVHGESRTISLSFTPSFIIICNLANGKCVAGSSVSENPCCVSGGFTIIHNPNTADPGLNGSACTYIYIAFR